MRFFNAILLVAAVYAIGWAGEPDAATAVVSPAVRQYLDHPSFEWKCERTEHFNICVEPQFESDHYIKTLKRNVERDRAQVLSVAGADSYDPLINVFLVRSRNRLKDLIGFDGDGRSRPHQHTIFSVVTPYRLHLTHEISHEVLTNIWGVAEPWIEEGVAVYATESLTVDQHCSHWMTSGQLVPLPKLVNADWNTATYSPDVTYPELGGFVKYLRETYGLDSIRRVWKGGSASIPEVFGKSLSHLEEEWLEMLKQQARKKTPPAG
jgi:hypothetical protein